MQSSEELGVVENYLMGGRRTREGLFAVPDCRRMATVKLKSVRGAIQPRVVVKIFNSVGAEFV